MLRSITTFSLHFSRQTTRITNKAILHTQKRLTFPTFPPASFADIKCLTTNGFPYDFLCSLYLRQTTRSVRFGNLFFFLFSFPYISRARHNFRFLLSLCVFRGPHVRQLLSYFFLSPCFSFSLILLPMRQVLWQINDPTKNARMRDSKTLHRYILCEQIHSI